jgi:hypothetical protein
MQQLRARGGARELSDAGALLEQLDERGVLSAGVNKTKVRLWYESLRRMNSTAVKMGGKGLHQEHTRGVALYLQQRPALSLPLPRRVA